MYETSCQSRFDARYWMLGAGALERPRGMEWGGRREEGSGCNAGDLGSIPGLGRSPGVIPFSCLQSFPASGSFPKSQFFASGAQSIGPRDSAGSGATEEGLTSRGGRHLRLPLSFGLILSSPSPPTFNLSQHQGLFHGVSCLYQVCFIFRI